MNLLLAELLVHKALVLASRSKLIHSTRSVDIPTIITCYTLTHLLWIMYYKALDRAINLHGDERTSTRIAMTISCPQNGACIKATWWSTERALDRG